MFSTLAAQIKSMVNQLGTKQDTSELRERLWVFNSWYNYSCALPVPLVHLYSQYLWFVYSQQVQHYTNQLAKETNKHLKDLGVLSLPVSLSEQVRLYVQAHILTFRVMFTRSLRKWKWKWEGQLKELLNDLFSESFG